MPFQDSTNLNNISEYIVDINGGTPYATIQAALDAANTAGVPADVFIRTGTYTENLTMYDQIALSGDNEGTTIIVGIHTPPAAGTLNLRNIALQSATDVFNSAVAGTTEISVEECDIIITNGYLFNLLNWTGTLEIFDCVEDASTTSGIINNTGGCNINIWHSFVGAGAGAFTKTGGEIAIFNSKIDCPITTAGAVILEAIMGSYFENTVILGGTTTSTFTNCSFATGANTAITHSSTNATALSNVSIDTSNVTAIGGAGAGNLQIGDITFLDSSAIAGTLTVDRTPVLTTGVARTTVIEAIGEGAGAQNVIDITPAVAIGGVVWAGVFIDGAALDPTAANSVVHAFECDLSGVATTNNPDLVGAHITMPAVPSEGCDSALRLEGYGITSILHCSERVAAGFTDGNIQQSQDITGFTALDTAAGRLVNVDNTGSTGGDYHGLDVSVTGAGTAAVVAVGTNPEVAVIHQHIGVFGATAQSWKFNGGFTDVTAAFDNPGVDVTIFDGDNDYIYIGTNAAFSQIRVILETVSGRNIRPIFEYSTVGPIWVPFDPIDGTNGFLQNGIIQWTSADLAGWVAVVVNGANHFYIRIQRTRNNIVTTPIEDVIRVLEPVEYYWNEDGDILAASVTANGLADTTGTQYEIVTFGAGGVLTGLGPLTNGQLVIGSTGASAVAATLTAPAAGITITGGAGTITFALADDLAAIEGLGTTGIVSRTAADTWAATTITQHAVLIGDAGEVPANLGPLTNGQLVIGSTGNAPATATLTDGNNITFSEGAGTITGDLTGTTDHTVQVGNATGSLTSLAAATNGQLVIGSTGADPAVAALASADGSVTITNGAGTIDLATAGIAWTVETAAGVAAAVNSGYITNRGGGITYTIPTTAAVGSIIRIAGLAGLWTIAQNAGESIVYGAFTTTVGVGGSLVATNAGDAIEILCIVADTTWTVLSSVGNITVN